MSPSTTTPSAGAAGSVPTVAAVHADPADMAKPGYPLDLNQIQGNVLGGFNKDYQTFLFLTFTDKAAARQWVGGIANEVATASEVARFDGLFKAVNSRRRGELGVLKATWMNVAFSHAGIKFLGASEANKFPDEFVQGMEARAGVNQDAGRSAPANWLPAFRGKQIHALLIVASDSQQDLGEHVLRYVHNMGLHGVQVTYLQDGAVRADEPGREHFGFRDGVSQPGVRHFDSHVPALTKAQAEPIHGNPGQDRVHAGEFVLGYPTQKVTPKDCGAGKSTSPNPDEGPSSPKHEVPNGDKVTVQEEKMPSWGTNGSYLVFRRLAQDVRGFHEMVDRLAKEGKFGTSDPAVVGAKLVGRYASGAPLERTADEEELLGDDFDPTKGDPSEAVAKVLGVTEPASGMEGDLAEDRRLNNHFEYGDDSGAIVPRAAHIRKAYPRDEKRDTGDENDSQIHRIIRRGIPFGTSFRPGLGAAGHGGRPGVEEPGDRGLLFLCYQSSLARQFEFIQRLWVHNADFPSQGDGEDPIIAQTPQGDFSLQDAAGKNRPKAHVQIMHFVTMTGGEYFFQPSIDALTKVLGTPPAASTPLPFLLEPEHWDVDDPQSDPCATAEKE
jgi:Dyp-type peroxidase family